MVWILCRILYTARPSAILVGAGETAIEVCAPHCFLLKWGKGGMHAGWDSLEAGILGWAIFSGTVRFCLSFSMAPGQRQVWMSGEAQPLWGSQRIPCHLCWVPLLCSWLLPAGMYAQLCPTLCHPMDSSPPGSSVHRIFQARTLEWVAISFSRGSSWPRDRYPVSCIFCIGGWTLYHWATWAALLPAGRQNSSWSPHVLWQYFPKWSSTNSRLPLPSSNLPFVFLDSQKFS